MCDTRVIHYAEVQYMDPLGHLATQEVRLLSMNPLDIAERILASGIPRIRQAFLYYRVEGVGEDRGGNPHVMCSAPIRRENATVQIAEKMQWHREVGFADVCG